MQEQSAVGLPQQETTVERGQQPRTLGDRNLAVAALAWIEDAAEEADASAMRIDPGDTDNGPARRAQLGDGDRRGGR